MKDDKLQEGSSDTGLIDFFKNATLYENMLKNRKITMSGEDILTFLEDKYKSLRESMDSDIDGFSKEMLFLKSCIVQEIFEDLIGIPKELRGWTTNEEEWLKELKERSDYKEKNNE